MLEPLEAQAATDQAEKGAQELGLNGNPPADWGNMEEEMARRAKETQDTLAARFMREQSSQMS